MMRRAITLNLLPLFLLSACSIQTNYDDGSPLFQQAKQFDAFVQQELAGPAKRKLQSDCKKSERKNIFCFSVNRSQYLFRRKAQRKKIARPRKKKPPATLSIRLSPKGTLINASRLRRARVPGLLKALSSQSLPTLKSIGRQVLKYKCPNRLAAATAATLEDYLPDPKLYARIASLYVKAGGCERRGSTDREHFYSRAGLMFYLDNNKKEALRWFRRSPPKDAFNGRSLYWMAKIEKQLGHKSLAEKHLQRLYKRHLFSFHAQAAALQNGEDLANVFLSRNMEWQTRSKSSPTANKLIQQAEVLNKYNFKDTAATISFWAINSYRRVEATVRLYLTKLGSPHTQVVTVPLLLIYHPRLRSAQSIKLFYPKAYWEYIDRYASGVDSYLVMALAHKESELNPLAVSPAGAKGLMQLNPTTAARLGGRGLDLFDLKTNVRIGANYFASLMDRYDDKAHVALSAYNAGEAQADRWQKRYPTDDPVLYADLLSYRETRNYVGFVLRNYAWYRRLYKGNSVGSLKSKLELGAF